MTWTLFAIYHFARESATKDPEMALVDVWDRQGCFVVLVSSLRITGFGIPMSDSVSAYAGSHP